MLALQVGVLTCPLPPVLQRKLGPVSSDLHMRTPELELKYHSGLLQLPLFIHPDSKDCPEVQELRHYVKQLSMAVSDAFGCWW